MVPPDGARAKRIPTLSWDSVVADAPASAPESHDPTPTPVPAPPTPASTAIASPSTEVSLLTLDLSSAPDIVVDDLDDEPVEELVEELDDGSVEELVEEPVEVRVRTTPPAVIVAALGDVTSAPVHIAEPAPADPLPEIREATPVTQPGPYLPAAPAAPVAATTAVPTFDVAQTRTAPSGQHRRPKRKRRGLKLLVSLLILAGLVGAGVVFGRAYLFPGDWDDATAPFATAVESERGVEFAEPLSIIAEPTADFSVRLLTELVPNWSDDLPTWRALGLVSGPVDETTLAEQVGRQQDALYSTLDGQVYHDSGAAGAQLDAELVQAMAAASLDQEFRWSSDQAARTLDDAAVIAAEVLRQARTIQAATKFDAEIAPGTVGELDRLPTLIAYRLLAPQVFAEFAQESQGGSNPLGTVDTGSHGPLGRGAPVVAAGPVVLDGDVITTSPVAQDRSMWFLIFAAFLDGHSAFSASEAVVESALTDATRGTTECVYATFSGGDTAQTATLRSALEAWVAAAPAEFASSFTVLDDGTMQLSSCDPGADFAGPTRSGTVAELLGWRAVEWATHDAVADTGGGDVEFSNVWGLIGDSDVPLEVAGTADVGGTAAAMVAVARERVGALYGSSG